MLDCKVETEETRVRPVVVGVNTLDDVERLDINTGDSRDGDVDNGELGSDGDTLLLRDIGGLDDHSFQELSLEQAGILSRVCDSFTKYPRCRA